MSEHSPTDPRIAVVARALYLLDREENDPWRTYDGQAKRIIAALDEMENTITRWNAGRFEKVAPVQQSSARNSGAHPCQPGDMSVGDTVRCIIADSCGPRGRGRRFISPGEEVQVADMVEAPLFKDTTGATWLRERFVKVTPAQNKASAE